MVEDKPKGESKSSRSIIGGRVISSIVGLSVGTAIYIPLFYLPDAHYQEFLRRPVVALDGVVVDDRYVQPTGGFGGRGSSYFFSVNTSAQEIVSIEVMDSYKGSSYRKIAKETIDARVGRGTVVQVRAREIASRVYKAFADEINVPKVSRRF